MAKEPKVDYDIILIPDHIVTERSSRLVLYLKENISPNVRSVIVELTHKTTKKTDFLVATRLGEDALLVQISDVKLAGEMEGVMKLDGRTNPKYPSFVLPVLTPLDTLFHNSITHTKKTANTEVSKVSNCPALLSATLAYLVTLSPHKVTQELNADIVLQNLMTMVQKKKNRKMPIFVQDICAGKRSKGETILHFSLRNCFQRLTYYLIDRENTPVDVVKLLASLDHESYDYLTPRFLANQFHPEIAPVLEKMYEQEIGRFTGVVSTATLDPEAQEKRKKSRKVDRKVSELVAKVKKKTSKKHSHGKALKRRSALVESQMEFGSWYDLSTLERHRFGSDMLSPTPPASPTSLEQSGRFSALEDDDYVIMQSNDNSTTTGGKKPRRKISLSVDEGLDRLMMMNRPLPNIPSDDSDDNDEVQEHYDTPRNSRLAPLDKIGHFDPRHSYIRDSDLNAPIYDIPKRLVPRWLSGSFIGTTANRGEEEGGSENRDGGIVEEDCENYDDTLHESPADYLVPISLRPETS